MLGHRLRRWPRTALITVLKRLSQQAQNIPVIRIVVSQPTKAIVSPWCKSLLQAIYLSRYVLWIPEMSARADNNFFTVLESV